MPRRLTLEPRVWIWILEDDVAGNDCQALRGSNRNVGSGSSVAATTTSTSQGPPENDAQNITGWRHVAQETRAGKCASGRVEQCLQGPTPGDGVGGVGGGVGGGAGDGAGHGGGVHVWQALPGPGPGAGPRSGNDVMKVPAAGGPARPRRRPARPLAPLPLVQALPPQAVPPLGPQLETETKV